MSSTVPVASRAVFRVGIGGARWSIGDRVDERAAARTLATALDLGIDHIDTATAYTTADSEAHNERIIRGVLDRRGLWDRVLVATKGGHHREGNSYPIDGSPATLRRDCERSLTALGRDHIDLYYLHFPDPRVPIEESVGALAGLRASGHIGAIGLCNVPLALVRRARAVTPIATVENPLSPHLAPNMELLEFCHAEGIAFIGYSPLGGAKPPTRVAELSPAAARVARIHGVTIETVLLAWLLGLTPSLALITGASRRESLASSVAAASVQLRAPERAAITADLEAHWARQARTRAARTQQSRAS